MMNFSFSIMSINRWILIIKGNNSVFNSDITMIWLDSDIKKTMIWLDSDTCITMIWLDNDITMIWLDNVIDR
jgi:hypothetical protein